MNLTRWFAGAAIVVGVGGCGGATAPDSSIVVGENQVRLTISSSASEVNRGTPVTFQVRLSNEGAAPVTLHFRDSCQINPYIRDRFGKILLPANGGWICLGALTELTLSPAEVVARQFVWTGSSAFQSEEPLRSFPAGKYFFSVEIPAAEGMLRATVPVALD
jgi:hypothetical protein